MSRSPQPRIERWSSGSRAAPGNGHSPLISSDFLRIGPVWPRSRCVVSLAQAIRPKGTPTSLQRSPTGSRAGTRNWLLVNADEIVDQVIRHAEMIAAGIGVRPPNVL